MSQIRGRDTKVEMMLRRALWARGLRFRVHYKIKGHPDVVFPRQHLVVFCDGNFWHGYQWDKLRKRLTNKFWYDKIKRNIQRDRQIDASLKKEGWVVLRIWEHEVRGDTNTVVKRILAALKKNKKAT